MLTFVDKPVTITYSRRQVDRLALGTSAVTLLVLIVITGFYCARDLVRSVLKRRTIGDNVRERGTT